MIQMGKSVYSLVLMDEVVDAIDQMAYRNNTSRSNLINQILAELTGTGPVLLQSLWLELG